MPHRHTIESDLLNSILHSNEVIMLLIDTNNGNIIETSSAAQQFYGYSKQAFQHLNIDQVNTLPKEAVKLQLKGVQEGTISNTFYKHRLSNGIIKDVHAIIIPTIYLSKRASLAIIEDVSYSKEKEAILNKFKVIADHSHAYIGMAALDGTVIYMNAAIRKDLAIPDNADLSLYKNLDFYSSAGRSTSSIIQEQLKLHDYWSGENEMQALDGNLIQVQQTVNRIKDNNGAPLFYTTTAINVSMLKAAELKLKESEKNLRKSEIVGRLGHWQYNIKTQQYIFSKGAQALYGIGDETATRDEIKALRLPAFDEMLDNTFNKLVQDNFPVEVDYQAKRKNDGVIVDLHVTAEIDPVSQIIFGSIKDITIKKNWERENIQLNKELRILNSHLQNLRTEERNKLAVEVHDKIGQRLVALRFELERMVKKAEGTEQQQQINGILVNTKEMIADFMETYASVKPVFLKHLPLTDAIEDLCRSFKKNTNCQVKFSSKLDKDCFDYDIKLTMLKIAAECFDNIGKYAKATEVTVKLNKDEESFSLMISDNGVGFSLPAEQHEHFGLLEIRELLASAGGRLSINAAPGMGTTVTAWLPY